MKQDEAALLGPEVLGDPTPLVRQIQEADNLTAQAVKAMLSLQTRQRIDALAPDAPLDPDLLASLLRDLHRLIRPWWPRFDLIESLPSDPNFVLEVDDQGYAHLRFGDGELGLQPQAGATFKAQYRIGNGPAGNLGAEAIAFVVLRQGLLDGVQLTPRNPLPAQGGTPQEAMAQAKLLAPTAFLELILRAITAADYAALAGRSPRLQGADAKLAWMGSWYEARVAVDPFGTEAPDPALLEEVEGSLHPFRRLGHDLEVVAAEYVPLDIELTVCVMPDYLRGHVEAALLQAFSSRLLPDGSLGFFHPDRLGFGEGVYLSHLVAAAQAVPGVQHVEVTRLQRLYEGPNGELGKGVLPLGTGQIAQVDNDPDFPEYGQFHVVMRGGR
jgi:predicted phage baseplate assembly protein